MPHMVIIPESESNGLEKSQERTFQMIQLRLMKEVLMSLRDTKSTKSSADDKELSRLMAQLMKSSRQQVKAIKGIKPSRVDLGGLESAIKRTMAKPRSTVFKGGPVKASMPAGMSGLKATMSKLESAVASLSAKMGKRSNGMSASQMDRLVQAASTSGKSRNRTFGSNF